VTSNAFRRPGGEHAEGDRALGESPLPSDRVALEVTGSCLELARIVDLQVDGVVVVSPDDTGITSARAKTDNASGRVKW
jgi:hypothetical protein